MTARPGSTDIRIEQDVGIPDLIRRLTEDSKRLAKDEMDLAKLELAESMHTATRGALWLGLAFGAGVIAMVAVTVMLVAAIGDLLGNNYWAGALITAALELVVGFVLLKKGLGTLAQPPYTLPETRAALRETAGWVRHPRAD